MDEAPAFDSYIYLSAVVVQPAKIHLCPDFEKAVVSCLILIAVHVNISMFGFYFNAIACSMLQCGCNLKCNICYLYACYLAV